MLHIQLWRTELLHAELQQHSSAPATWHCPALLAAPHCWTHHPCSLPGLKLSPLNLQICRAVHTNITRTAASSYNASLCISDGLLPLFLCETAQCLALGGTHQLLSSSFPGTGYSSFPCWAVPTLLTISFTSLGIASSQICSTMKIK